MHLFPKCFIYFIPFWLSGISCFIDSLLLIKKRNPKRQTLQTLIFSISHLLLWECPNLASIFFLWFICFQFLKISRTYWLCWKFLALNCQKWKDVKLYLLEICFLTWLKVKDSGHVLYLSSRDTPKCALSLNTSGQTGTKMQKCIP